MSGIVKLNDDIITADSLIKYLKVNGDFEEIVEKIISDRITADVARKRNLAVTDEELQERFDQLRRVLGLHRAKDTLEYIESLGFSVDEYGEYNRDELLRSKMLDIVCSEENIEEYFKLNSPQFDTVELRHILVMSEGEARELAAILEDDPDCFPTMAMEHSLATDTAKSGGSLGKIMRGMLADELEAKVFNASAGDILGPYLSEDELTYEIFQVDFRQDAELNAKTRDSIVSTLKRDWIEARLGEYKIELI